MNLFRVRHPSLGTQYFLADAPSAEEWDDTTHFLPLHHRGAAGRQVRLGGPQHAYKDGLARAQLRDHVPETLTRAQISVERISLDALDEIHVSERDEPVKSRALLHMGTVSSRVGARTGFWVSAATPGRCEVYVLDGEGEDMAFHAAPTMEEAMGECLGMIWDANNPRAPSEYEVVEQQPGDFARAVRAIPRAEAPGPLHPIAASYGAARSQTSDREAFYALVGCPGSYCCVAFTRDARGREAAAEGYGATAGAARERALSNAGWSDPEAVGAAFTQLAQAALRDRLRAMTPASVAPAVPPTLEFAQLSAELQVGSVREPQRRAGLWIEARAGEAVSAVLLGDGGAARIDGSGDDAMALYAQAAQDLWNGVVRRNPEVRSITAADAAHEAFACGPAAPAPSSVGLSFGEVAMEGGRYAAYALAADGTRVACAVFLPGGGGGTSRAETAQAAVRDALLDAGWERDHAVLAEPRQLSAAYFSQAMRGRVAGARVAEASAPGPSALAARLDAFAAGVEAIRAAVLATLRVLVGLAPLGGERRVYGGAAQFELKGEARARRVAYLHGLYDGATLTASEVLTLLVGGEDHDAVLTKDP